MAIYGARRDQRVHVNYAMNAVHERKKAHVVCGMVLSNKCESDYFRRDKILRQ